VQEQKQIQIIQGKALSGSNGANIKRFIVAYKSAYNNAWKTANELYFKSIKSEGKTISCKSGCMQCCFQYIQTTLGHGIIIVDYLYSNPKKLQAFVKNYHHMNKEGMIIADDYDKAFLSHVKSRTLRLPVPKDLEDIIDKYHDLQIPCPFLDGSRCSIYPIRPMACAAHYSVNPPAWCTKENKALNKTVEVMPTSSDMARLREVGPRVFSIYALNAPQLIYELLTEGIDAVWKRATTQLGGAA
jgi:Fe-S-cluster containining protein